jgi:4-amino-4-deoxy-L-arabinose transferase-like glycosyltransferase
MAPWAAVFLYLALTLPQLALPGLHYDEAKEAGLNAMEMLQRQDVHAFRSAGIQIGALFLPLMVQDYIGALNVYLALPFLALFGVTASALRLVAVTCGLATLLLVRKLGNELAGNGGPVSPATKPSAPAGYAGDLAALLLAVSPSFVFWSRQGIFVTNIVVTLAVVAVWMAWRWRTYRQPRYLYLLALAAGLGLWAKLLFVWVLGALAGVAATWWIVDRRARGGMQSTVGHVPSVRPRSAWVVLRPWFIAALLFMATLSPLILFNQQTGGTLQSVFGNLGQSYYGVQNAAFLDNLRVRLEQVVTLLRGDHFWYLGGSFANAWSPWLAAGIVISGLALAWPSTSQRRTLLMAIWFVTLLALQSCFTVSDLFVTHYAIVQPFLWLLAALAAEAGLRAATGRFRSTAAAKLVQGLLAAALVIWFVGDLRVDGLYHRSLAQSGGHAAHSDASYDLAAWLDTRDAAQPLAMDWGLDAPVRYLAANRVRPLELFGYERLDAPDDALAERLLPFLEDTTRLYIFHTAEDAVFRGRREALAALAAERGLRIDEEATFYERSGRPLIEVLRVVP